MRFIGKGIPGAAMIILLILGPLSGLAQKTWDGGAAPNNNWSANTNWADNTAPANPYPNAILFNNNGLGTNVVDQNWIVQSLSYTNSTLLGGHTTDLNGNTLIISNNAGGYIYVGNSQSNTVVTIRNGTLQLGTSKNSLDLYCGYNLNNNATGVLLTISSVMDAVNIREVSVPRSSKSGSEAILDLSGATITSGGVTHKLKMSGSLSIGQRQGSTSSANGILKLPPALTALEVGGEFVLAEFYNSVATLDFGVGSHLNSFSVSNEFRIGGYSGKGTLLNFPAGVNVRIGNPDAPVKLLLGNSSKYELPSGSHGALILTNGSFVAYLSQLKLGAEEYANMRFSTGILDLASCAAVQIGTKPNEVIIPDLRLGSGNTPPSSGNTGYGRVSLPASVTNVSIGYLFIGGDLNSVGILEFATNSGLKAFSVTNTFVLGYYSKGYLLGLPANGLRFRMGTESTPIRMDIGCGVQNGAGSPEGRLILTNAIVSAYLTDLRIGNRNNGTIGGVTGELDLTNSTLSVFNVISNVTVGYSTSVSGSATKGYLRLPSGIVNVASNVYIGNMTSVETGLLELRGTRVNVEKSVHVQSYGTVSIWLNRESAGFSINSSDTNDFTISAGGKINVVAQENPAPGTSYWGLRMKGDQEAYFKDLLASGRMTVNKSALTPYNQTMFAVNFDGTYTLLGIKPSPGTLILIK